MTSDRSLPSAHSPAAALHLVALLVTALTAAVVAVIPVGLRPPVGVVAMACTHPQHFVDTVGSDQAAIDVLTLLIWAVLGWLAAGLGCLLGGRIPGLTGRILERTASGMLPVVMHRTLATAIGVSLAAGGGPGIAVAAGAGPGTAVAAGHPAHPAPFGTITAAASPRHEPTATTTHPVAGHARAATRLSGSAGHASRMSGGGRHTSAAVVDPPDLDWPAQPREATRHASDTVRVRRGDSLWGIAAAHLPPSATDRAIAAAWPRWYAANRAVIGSDPDLILPGQMLVPPQPAAGAR